MRRITAFLAAAACAAVAAQSPESPLSDTRLSVHTLLREDIFAGFLDDNLDRFAKGEKNIETLLERRPAEKPSLLAWKAGATLYRAVRAMEDNRPEEFEKKYEQAVDLFAQAKALGPEDPGVTAIIGGVYALMADRMPEKKKDAAWSRAYDAYRDLWKAQGQAVARLPLHLRGELLGGLAETARRTGHAKESDEYVDKILDLLPDSSYARVARRWKDDPASATTNRITCLSCHAPGRLAARRAALEEK